MDWAIRAELADAEFREKIRAATLDIPAAQRPADLQWLVDWQPLIRRQMSLIDRSFNEKVDFLASLPGKLNPALQAPLKHLHQYRNQAYHRGEVRPATLTIACRLLVEINCELLLSQGWGGSSYGSAEDYSWLEKRFEVRASQTLGDSDFIQRVAEETRRRVFIDASALGAALADHLVARIADLRSAIDFVLEGTRLFRSPAEVFRASQYRGAALRSGEPAAPLPPGGYTPRLGLEVLDDPLARRAEISQGTTRIEAFRSILSSRRLSNCSKATFMRWLQKWITPFSGRSTWPVADEAAPNCALQRLGARVARPAR